MNTLAALNQAMQYIENNLLEEVDLEEAAKIGCCSAYHFKRMFSFLAGMPIGEYIRRRRLAKGAELIRDTTMKVIDVAVYLGYNSSEAFTKAFQAMHGVPPSLVKKGNVNVKAFPPMQFQLSIQGGNEMVYRLEKKDAFSIIGIKETVKLVYEGVNPEIDAMWQRLAPEDYAVLKALNDTDPKGILCVSANFEQRAEEGSMLDQYIGVAVAGHYQGKWTQLSVEPSLWAVFTAIGPFPETLQNTWARIYSEWFPSSGFELTGGPEILWNESPDVSKADFKSEIWIPVKEGLAMDKNQPFYE